MLIRLKEPFLNMEAGQYISVSDARAKALIEKGIAFDEQISQEHARRYSGIDQPVINADPLLEEEKTLVAKEPDKSGAEDKDESEKEEKKADKRKGKHKK